MINLNYLVWKSGTWKTELLKKINISENVLFINWLKDWFQELNKITNEIAGENFKGNIILIDEYKKIVENKESNFILWLIMYQLENKDKNYYITFTCESADDIKDIEKIMDKYLYDVKWNLEELIK